MIIHQDHKPKRGSIPFWIPALLLVLALGLLYISTSKGGEEFWFCDMEKTIEGGAKFISNGTKFGNGKTQSDHKARSGSFASKCDGVNRYGATLKIHNVYSGDVIEASIWRQSDDGYGVLAFQGDWNFYEACREVSKQSNSWEKISGSITVPVGVHDGILTVIAYNPEMKGSVYFDDLEVKRTKHSKTVMPAKIMTEASEFELIIDDQGMEKIRNKKTEAFSVGNLITGPNDLVPAKWRSEGNELDVEARLKGDLLDHLTGRKWSFRIKTNKNEAWKGMQEFSVHNALSRYHLAEWVFHEMLRKEDVLTSRYDFFRMKLNGEILGTYAYEEHFTDPLLIHQDRDPGPILKINEDGHWFWASKNLSQQPPWYESAQIEAFGMKKILNDNDLKRQYEEAQSLLKGFMDGTLPASEVFDTERMAKYLAIVDVCNAWHSFNYTNLRFYYNAGLNRLEPIGFDGFTPDGLKYNKDLYIIGSQVNTLTDKDDPPHKFVKELHKQLFLDMDFMNQYIEKLEAFSSEDYIKKFEAEIDAEIKIREVHIGESYKGYKFDRVDFFRNAKQIRAALYPMQDISVKAYRGDQAVRLQSFHLLPIEVVGFGNKELTFPLKKTVYLPAYDKQQQAIITDVNSYGKFKNVFCRTVGTAETKSIPIFKWDYPEMKSLQTKTQVDVPNFVKSKGEDWVISAGTYVINKSMNIPKAKTLFVSAGANLDLQSGAAILCEGSIQMMGTKDKPVKLYSSDGSGQGIFISNAQEKSVFEFAHFDGLNAIRQNATKADGVLSLYKSDVSLFRVQFTNTKSKDAIQLQHSNYYIRDAVFANIVGDGIDANFSKGEMENLYFDQVGKDAIEISGGHCEMNTIQIKNAQVSGINTRWKAQVSGTALKIESSTAGLSILDASVLNLESLELSAVEQGVLAFRKEPIFEGSKTRIKKIKLNNVQKDYVIEQGSILVVDGKTIATN